MVTLLLSRVLVCDITNIVLFLLMCSPILSARAVANHRGLADESGVVNSSVGLFLPGVDFQDSFDLLLERASSHNGELFLEITPRTKIV